MPAPLTTPGEILDQISAQKPDEIVITTIMRDGSDDAITRQALKRRSDGMNQALRDAGIRPGDFVPIHLPTCTDFLVATIAVFKAGGTPMPVSDRLPDSELTQLLALAEPKVIISRALSAPVVLDPADFQESEPSPPSLPILVSNRI